MVCRANAGDVLPSLACSSSELFVLVVSSALTLWVLTVSRVRSSPRAGCVIGTRSIFLNFVLSSVVFVSLVDSVTIFSVARTLETVSTHVSDTINILVMCPRRAVLASN